jgi:hypothetical protein
VVCYGRGPLSAQGCRRLRGSRSSLFTPNGLSGRRWNDELAHRSCYGTTAPPRIASIFVCWPPPRPDDEMRAIRQCRGFRPPKGYIARGAKPPRVSVPLGRA